MQENNKMAPRGEERVACALGAPSVRKGGVEGPVGALPAGRSRLPPAREAAWTGSGCGRRRAPHETPGQDPGLPSGHRGAFPFLNLHSPACLDPLGVLGLLGERLDQGEAKSERIDGGPRGHPRGVGGRDGTYWEVDRTLPLPTPGRFRTFSL